MKTFFKNPVFHSLIMILISAYLIPVKCQHNFCEFVKLSFSGSDAEGSQNLVGIGILENYKGNHYKEFRRYKNQFDYLLMNSLQPGKKAGSKFDTTMAAKIICKELNQNSNLQIAFDLLLNKSKEKLKINFKEVMNIASRFFYISHINTADSIATVHTSLGIHGQRELHPGNAFLAIEAFCYEAILATKDKSKYKYMSNLEHYKELSGNFERSQLRSMEMMLDYIRNKVYHSMSEDKELQEAISTYYKKHGKNTAIEIIYE